jgi:serine phosphatase RsbU (regulator of sigma subunit)/anti-sigma regulatory factor (Ser/Thr protein kinase)
VSSQPTPTPTPLSTAGRPRVSYPGTLEALEPLRAYVKEAGEAAGLDRSAVYNLCLAIDEIATNVVLYGYERAGLSGDISVEALNDGRRLEIVLTDNAKPYDPASHQDPSEESLQLPLEDRPIGGLGIMLAKDAVDELQYESGESGNRHRFIVNIPLSHESAERSLATLSDSQRKLEILLHISRALGEEIHLDRLFQVIVSEVSDAMSADRSSLFLLDEAAEELVSKVAEGMGMREIRIPLTVGIAGATARERRAINIPDAYRDSRFNPAVDKQSGFLTRSILSTPIITRDDRLIGVVQVLNKAGGEPFNREDEVFLHAICIHLGLALERARLIESYVQAQKMQQSLQLAHDIQMGLLPKKFPAFPDKPEIDIYATIAPAQDVGGDLYDFFLIDDDHLCMMIGDVSDKGIPAALFMAMVRSAFKISALQNAGSVASILRTVNRFVYENNESQMFVTMFAGILDLRTGIIEYSDGGHEPPFILRCRKGVQLFQKQNGLALGFLDDFEYSVGTIQLDSGDALVLYTDGVNEAMNLNREMFRTEALAACLEAVCDEGSADTVTRTIIEHVTQFVSGAPQSDDITVMTLRYQGR